MRKRIADILLYLSIKVRKEPLKKLAPFDRDYELGHIEPVFEDQGVTYYKFSDERNIITRRGLVYLDVLNELDFMVKREDLKKAFEGIKNQLNQGNLVEVLYVIKEISQRMDYITNIDLVYKLASILYFDKSEDPRDYDVIYNEKKINKWKESNIKDFFLKTDIIELLPFGQLSELNMSIQEYLALEEKDQKTLANILKTAIERQ